MSSDFVTRVEVVIDGQDMDDFKTFKEMEVEHAKEVPLMYETGFAEKTPRRKFSLDYVVPSGKAEFNFAALKNATISVAKDGGVGRRTYTGCRRLTIGEVTYDGDNEAVKTITFGARKMVEE
jgi:hypothetical protein